MEYTRDFKGIWIPKEIYLAKDLGWSEKILLIEIDSLDNEEGCFASNDFFANFLGISKGRVSKNISSLVKKGYVTSRAIYKAGSKEVEKRILHTTIGYGRLQQRMTSETEQLTLDESGQGNETCLEQRSLKQISDIGCYANAQQVDEAGSHEKSQLIGESSSQGNEDMPSHLNGEPNAWIESKSSSSADQAAHGLENNLADSISRIASGIDSIPADEIVSGIEDNAVHSISNNIGSHISNSVLSSRGKQKGGLNALIATYTSNPELIDSIRGFIKMRTAKKKPVTDRALKMLLNHLDKLESTDERKIRVLDQSTLNCWQGLFPLKEEKINQERIKEEKGGAGYGQNGAANDPYNPFNL